MFTVRPYSGLSNLVPLGKSGFPLKSASLSEAQLLAQEKDLWTAISSLSLNMWESKFLASLISEEASTSPSSFLSSLETVVRSFQHFNVVIARRLVNPMATLQRRDCILKSVDPRIMEQEKVSL